MANNRRSRAAVDEAAPDTQTRAVGPDGTVDDGRSSYDREAVGDTRTYDGDTAAQRDGAHATAAGDREGVYYGGQAVDEHEADRSVVTDADEREAGDRRIATGPDTATVRPARVRARGSLVTTIGLIISVVALCATLTGLLAPEGLALGVIGVAVSLTGMAAARREGVTGSATAGLSVVIGLVAVVLAVLAMTGNFTWPNSRTNQIQVWHDWLVAHWSTLNRW